MYLVIGVIVVHMMDIIFRPQLVTSNNASDLRVCFATLLLDHVKRTRTPLVDTMVIHALRLVGERGAGPKGVPQVDEPGAGEEVCHSLLKPAAKLRPKPSSWRCWSERRRPLNALQSTLEVLVVADECHKFLA